MADSLNSIDFMDTLVEGGFPEKQAKALALAMYQLIDSQLVTKSYLDMRMAELRAEMAQLKAELIQLIVTVVVVQTGVTAVLFKFLH
jgi:uncharacterized small protein (DUF1192 family)